NDFQEYLYNIRNVSQQEVGQPTAQEPPPVPPNSPPSQQPGLSNPGGGRADIFRGREGQQTKQQVQPQARRSNFDPDTAARMQRGALEKGGTSYSTNSSVGPQTPADNNRSRDDKQPVVILGPMTPFWLSGEGEDLLVLARLVQIGRKPACQV